MNDCEALEKGHTFFELIKSKKLALQLSADYDEFLRENHHENEEYIRQFIKNIK